eukprot:107968_1
MKSSTECMFYCEMTVKPHKAKRYGAISLTLFRLPSKQNQATISCYFYCEQMDFYVRFDDAIIKLDGDENNAKQTAFFEWQQLEDAVQRDQVIKWKIVVIHKDSKRVNVDNETANSIKHNMKIHETNAMQLQNALANNESLKYRPLHRFDASHVCDVIQCWVLNDIQFKDHLKKIITIFVDCSLSGDRIMSLSMGNIRRILEPALLGFMTKDTFDLILNRIKHWKTVDDENITKKSTEEIGAILANHPLNRLLARICNKNDIINGEKCIQYYAENYPWINNVTGWNETETYQIHSVLFKYDAFSS